MSFFSCLRQFLFPPEFRITPIKSYDFNTILKVVANLPDKGVSTTMSHAYTSLTSIWNILIQAGVTVREHTGLLYESRLPLTVMGYEEILGISEPTIVKTMKPTVYLQGNPVQYGEVIVGLPQGKD